MAKSNGMAKSIASNKSTYGKAPKAGANGKVPAIPGKGNMNPTGIKGGKGNGKLNPGAFNAGGKPGSKC